LRRAHRLLLRLVRRGEGATNDRPYNETNTYDAMNHLSSHDVLNWDTSNSTGTLTFSNNRNSSSTYDADGRITASSSGNYVYDAAAHINSFGDGDPFMTDQQFDGDGNRVKSVQRRFDEQTSQWVTETVTYYVNSTVLGGQLLTELTAQGAKERTLVFQYCH